MAKDTKAPPKDINFSVKARWEKLNGEKTQILDRARQCTKITIPHLLPPEGTTQNDSLDTPYQSVGARAVNNLASKLLLALLPPNAPFFRLIPDPKAMSDLKAQAPDKAQEIDNKLSQLERDIAQGVEKDSIRVPTFAALKLLVTTGNTLVFKEKGGGMRTYNISQYCVKRDAEGNPLEIVLYEKISPKLVPDSITLSDTVDMDRDIEVFTYIQRVDNDKFEAWQEIEKQEVPGTRGSYKKDELPWLALRWTAINGEDYGRGLVEQYLGDLQSLETLTQAIVEGTAQASKVLWLVNPNGTTRINDVAKAPSGSVKPGMAQDVTVIHMDKYNDFRLAFEASQSIERRLSQAFLLATSVARESDRTTATEVQFMIQELEDALGGIYSVLAQEFQLPLVRLLMSEYAKNVPKELFTPAIITGVEALGRGHDFTKLVQFAQTLQQLLGADITAQYTNVGAVIDRIGTSLGIDTKGLIKTPEEMQQEQQMAQQSAITSQGLSQAAMSGGDVAGQHLGAMATQALAQQQGA